MQDYRMPARAEYFKAKGYWKGDTIVDYLSRIAEQFPDKVGIVDPYARLTWKEVENKSQALALHLPPYYRFPA
ncbi:MAG: 2,3-dihydroxybenzoate-AMP ligase [Candidatus Saccharibacteria bacterium GW2011_GWC2_48_9]|nr:MAG: 2,3-dihydroxybenzoate-AMP ligase [Candidatus Saccharibacteria bacterium GW2011_GWC2_48_9]